MNRYIGKTRFTQKAHKLLNAINVSIDFDRLLYRQDIQGSKAHAQMLAACKIISKEDETALLYGLDKIEKDIQEERFHFQPALEDIHMHVEAALADHIGAEIAGKLHTARSRNDQVALDLRLYIRERLDQLHQTVTALQKSLAQCALEHCETIMPGFTHLQIGQVIVFGHHCLAYVEMFARDKGRFKDARKRLNENPLGAAALAGTSFAIDRNQTTSSLGFDRPSANALDAVSDRDFVIESLAALSLCSVHLSRLSEEIILWASPAFDFIRLSDDFSTGSSIMPQKRNPDPAELVRAKTGRIAAALMDMIIVMKGLPLAYAKDMQQDKQAVFLAFDETELSIQVISALLQHMVVNKTAMAQMAERGYPTAADLADWLVREKNIPFRQAHEITASLVKLAEDKKLSLAELEEEDMQNISPLLTLEIKPLLSLESSVKSKTSFGGTAPNLVRAAAQTWLEKL